jgi:quercetin dioxygenase-like cupin family protein
MAPPVDAMRAPFILVAALWSAGSPPPQTVPAGRASPAAERAAVALDNARVRAYRTTTGILAGIDHGPGVVIWLRDGARGAAGHAIWLEDVAVPAAMGESRDPIVIVQPLAQTASRDRAPAGSKPGDAPFTGMSFVPLFENTRVSVIRARMEIDAREGLHTHGSDTIVVHLSGGDIEDTANGKTIVNRWRPGDVEFESRGSSHSARNVSHPVDVVLVALKP